MPRTPFACVRRAFSTRSRRARSALIAVVAVAGLAQSLAATHTVRANASPPDNADSLYTLDGWGGVHAVGGSPPVQGFAYWPGWDIARGIASLPGQSRGYTLDGFGGIHAFGGAPQLNDSAYWPGWDIARGITLTPAGTGGWVLDGFGGIHRFGTAPQLSDSAYWPGWDIARGIVSDSSGLGGWVLDGFGGIHAFGDAPPLNDSAYWSGWDIARGIATFGSGGGGYVLDGFGGIHPFGDAPPVGDSAYWPGWDIARAVVLRSTSSPSQPEGWVVDGFGGVHPFGGAPALSGAYWSGWDIVRGAGGAGESGSRSYDVPPPPFRLSPTSTSGSIGLWAADWSGAASQRTTAGWEAAAQSVDLMVGPPDVYKKWVTQLHAWNPHLLVLGYDLGPFLTGGSTTFDTILSQHPDWFAHDAGGHLVTLAPSFPDNYLMDVSNPAYRAWHAQQLAAMVKADGLDGAMDDSVGPGPVTGYANSMPVDPATGQAYTPQQYLDDIVLMLNTDKAALDGKYLAFNGLESGPMYVQCTDILATSDADAGIAELFLRQANDSISTFPSAAALQDSLYMMQDMAAHGKAFLGWTKVWVNAPGTQVQQWEQYALDAYLLGKQSYSYLDFMPASPYDNTVVSYPNLREDMGSPLGSYFESGPVFERPYQGGMVSLNTSTDRGS